MHEMGECSFLAAWDGIIIRCSDGVVAMAYERKSETWWEKRKETQERIT